jgi:hypothetical protein
MGRLFWFARSGVGFKVGLREKGEVVGVDRFGEGGWEEEEEEEEGSGDSLVESQELRAGDWGWMNECE